MAYSKDLFAGSPGRIKYDKIGHTETATVFSFFKDGVVDNLDKLVSFEHYQIEKKNRFHPNYISVVHQMGNY